MSKNWDLKYRPRTLAQVLGQDYSKKILYGALRLPEKPHTWLLQGGWGTGKTTCCRIIAKALICQNPTATGEACNTCWQCTQLDIDESLNYREIDSAHENAEQIRALIEQEANLAPIDAPRRVFTLDEVHLLSKTAQTALLKTLEEGVGQTIFLLATTNPEKLLPTIRSRCTIVSFTPVNRSLVFDHLKYITSNEKCVADDDALKIIVDHTYGHIRDSIKLTQQLSYAGEITVDVVKQQLHLHLDEDAALLLLEVADSWVMAESRVAALVQDHPVSDLWAAVRQTVERACLYFVQPSRERPHPAVMELVERYGARLHGLAEWVLGVGSHFSLHTATDLLVGLALIRERLGVNQTTTSFQNHPRLGPSKRERLARGLDHVTEPLTEEALISLFLLVPVEQKSIDRNGSA